ncbi:uncharacterized protein K460DRAFT_337753 [Cucurbitaria berberidis CBS 394.84]|uniref:WSC domain-containing protein n=1 Tax=Cucurbitaria berberidis CBS 394.84 TaxID=1168544 RepID=A0A9P4GHF9_9PLEO|nr:uncharacterized protein K460DRAFT_337753 [Cucurbitaria berberidis CBS 394.84]KAF1845491.1 hypothetical protein K460DRAFT_337753 [Cucurbitaria berberidis CBS 394.84]
MKPFLVFSQAALIRLVASTRTPLLQFDPNTTKDCAEWHNVADGGETCDYVRKLYGITPAEFHEWNPLIGLDCTPWYDWQSYCIVTQRRLDSVKPSTTSSSVTVSSPTSASSLAPSPTAWDSLGCYAQDPARSILEQNMNPSGDDSLTILDCKSTCYRGAYTFAGVQQGNQCWCSSFVGGEWAKNQTDCNVPCTGDKNTVCGGKGVFNIFEALSNSIPAVISSTPSSVASSTTRSVTSSATSSASAATAAPTSNGATPNRALFGMGFRTIKSLYLSCLTCMCI